MNIVIYARFSSHKQNEQSIEGQLKVCYEYAGRLGYRIIGEYIDRAQSAKTDDRTEFKRMIEDSAKKHFEAVLVYQLDRFSRNRYDSAIYKAKLKRNGVRVLSARENISDDASGVLMEAVLEGMAEYYSVELAQKVKRGLRLVAEKCQTTGTRTPLGYKVGEDKRFYIDESAATVVQEIYKMYSDGQTVAQITAYLNARQLKTSSGTAFNKNSLTTILKNKKYLGIYIYDDMEIPDGMPRIIADELFYKVQAILDTNRKAPARARAKEEYLLTTKLFCGHCKSGMVGVSGTSKTGAIYNYYACVRAKQKLCNKKTVSKQWLEDLVVQKCRDLLTDEGIGKIAASVVASCERSQDDTNLRRIQKLIKENERAIENLFKALEVGQVADQITKRIQEKNIERNELEQQLFAEQKGKIIVSVSNIKFFLTRIRKGSINDIKNRKALIIAFVNAIYLYDDKITLVLNAADKPVEITLSLLNDIENAVQSSYIDNSGSPNYISKRNRVCIKLPDFFIFLFYGGILVPKLHKVF